MMETSLKKDWTVTPEAFDKLLRWLDADREVAGEKYEKIRQKLIKLFKWRNCTPEEDYADITINRVTRRVSENASVDASNPYLYFHGTALNVLREYWRGHLKHKQEDFEDLEQLELTSENPLQKIEKDLEQKEISNRFACMRQCLEQLPTETRKFIVEYHHGISKKDARKEMAEKLKLSLNVLRIRACRIRETLQKCVDKCVENSG